MRGDVVLLDHPFTDLSGSKVRPTLVISADDPRLNSVVVAMITKNLSRVGEPTQHFVDIATPDGARSGLNASSAVVCTNLFTVNQTIIRRRIGGLSGAMMAQINQCLRAALDL